MKIRVQGLQEFMQALRRSLSRIDGSLQRALADVGVPTLADAARRAPRRTGELASSGRIEVRGSEAALVFELEKAPVLEFAGRGKYQSLTERWGPPPRFGHPAVENRAADIEEGITRALKDDLDAGGWARG